MKWTITFYIGGKEATDRLEAFLAARLNKAYTFKRHLGEIVVGNCRDKDESWRVALFIKNQSGLWNPTFIIEGRDESGNLVYISNCQTCRDKTVNTPHSQHSIK